MNHARSDWPELGAKWCSATGMTVAVVEPLTHGTSVKEMLRPDGGRGRGSRSRRERAKPMSELVLLFWWTETAMRWLPAARRPVRPPRKTIRVCFSLSKPVGV